MTDKKSRLRMSRRGLLLTAGVVAGAASTASGLSLAYADESEPYHGADPGEPGGESYDLSATATTRTNSLGGAKLYYEPSRDLTSFTFDQTFYNQLVTWRNKTGDEGVPAGWGGRPTRIYSYGAKVNKPGMHGSGRAFDIASVYFTSSDGKLHKRFDCRYDQWKNSSSASSIRKRYWAFAASLHLRFQHVLTYKYNSAHHNHIHVDNDVYGTDSGARFSTGSKAQVQFVQAACRYIWGHDTDVDGIWGPQTKSHSTSVLRRIGQTSGTIADTRMNWRRFNLRSLQQGTGRSDY